MKPKYNLSFAFDNHDISRDREHAFRERVAVCFVRGMVSCPYEMKTFAQGQRWMSEAEPELGLGMILEMEHRTVKILFPSTGEIRMYAKEQAPIKRVLFQAGDKIESHEGAAFVIQGTEEKEGLMYYYGDEQQVLPEMQIADSMNLGTADRRLLDGRVDESSLFDLRLKALELQSNIHQHPAHGYIGARMDLIPHQLYIAQEVASRFAPRVLLADEVGLGKTIEACLILHRLFVRGRSGRVLILVPEPLIHQWFVELLRRFNLSFSIFNEERCQSMQAIDSEANPFADEHLILTSLSLFKENPKRLQEALAVDWGLTIVDEVHHLKWSKKESSLEYRAVEAFAKKSTGLLLLTGTPEQFGAEGHFARLRLLDPIRFHSYERFQEESNSYQQTAEVVDRLILKEPLKAQDEKILGKLFGQSPQALTNLKALVEQPDLDASRDHLISDLLDCHGTGRVVFRNTRSAIAGFPKRKILPAALTFPKTDIAVVERVKSELAYEVEGNDWKQEPLAKDPRIDWLLRLIKKYSPKKILLICRYKERAEAIYEAVMDKLNLKMTVFHEDQTIIQRDRNAAWFAEPEGAQLLLCSEIGSEGRNFQFAHHLVLFDLPLDPELLEQRIGRLDRIGQKETIQIHVPYFKHSGAETVFQWLHQGLEIFTAPSQGGELFMEKFGQQLKGLILGDYDQKKLDALIEETQAFRKELLAKLEKGRDRLLERHSFQPEKAKKLISDIEQFDQSTALDQFLLKALDHFGVHIEEMGEDRGKRIWLLKRGQLVTDQITFIPEEGKLVTLDRTTALSRDDVEFLTWDHPIANSIMDLLLCSEAGNAAFAELESDDLEPGLYTEMIFILEGSCPPQFDIKRFLPRTSLHIAYNQSGTQLPQDSLTVLRKTKKTDAPKHLLAAGGEALQGLLKDAKDNAQEWVEDLSEYKRKEALKLMKEVLTHEKERLMMLKQRNGLVSEKELKLLEEEEKALLEAISKSQVRLDAIRLIRVV
ncbi:MAG: RNA polymerase-associated protein RapA [Verrucomicrobiota bacterium]